MGVYRIVMEYYNPYGSINPVRDPNSSLEERKNLSRQITT